MTECCPRFAFTNSQTLADEQPVPASIDCGCAHPLPVAAGSSLLKGDHRTRRTAPLEHRYVVHIKQGTLCRAGQSTGNLQGRKIGLNQVGRPVHVVPDGVAQCREPREFAAGVSLQRHAPLFKKRSEITLCHGRSRDHEVLHHSEIGWRFGDAFRVLQAKLLGQPCIKISAEATAQLIEHQKLDPTIGEP